MKLAFKMHGHNPQKIGNRNFLQITASGYFVLFMIIKKSYPPLQQFFITSFLDIFAFYFNLLNYLVVNCMRKHNSQLFIVDGQNINKHF